MDNFDVCTYCVVGEDLCNKVVKLNSTELEVWKEKYINDFYKSYLTFEDSSLDVRRYYCDPDTTYKKGYNHEFFMQLVLFLQNQEKNLSKRLRGRFEYEFVVDKGIKVTGTDKNNNDINPFYLRSDQLGFSSPSNNKAHPYDLFIMQSHSKNKAIKQVSQWIATSRTIGGSFLWPTPFYYDYNPARGGKITSSRRYYIQDRVDLTLWEIKNWYEKSNENTILQRNNKDNSNLIIWLEHFVDFDTYVNFFCFEAFIQKNDNEASPIYIFKEDNNVVKEPEWGFNGENPPIEISKDLEHTKLERMLSFVNICIMERTKKITKLLNI